MLGFLHKVNLHHAHPTMLELFPRRGANGANHDKSIWPFVGDARAQMQHPDLFKRSIFQLVFVYNALPQAIVDAISVSEFQHHLTNVARRLCFIGNPYWQTFLSGREFGTVQGWRQLFEL